MQCVVIDVALIYVYIQGSVHISNFTIKYSHI